MSDALTLPPPLLHTQLRALADGVSLDYDYTVRGGGVGGGREEGSRFFLLARNQRMAEAGNACALRATAGWRWRDVPQYTCCGSSPTCRSRFYVCGRRPHAPPTRHRFSWSRLDTPPPLPNTQPYADMPPEAINEEYLWGRLEPLLGYLPANERAKVRRERESEFFVLPRRRDVGSLCGRPTASVRRPPTAQARLAWPLCFAVGEASVTVAWHALGDEPLFSSRSAFRPPGWHTRPRSLFSPTTTTHPLQVREALSLAYDSHAGQARKSGEPFVTHPVEVAAILAGLRADAESVAAGLLHDTVEDCDAVSFAEIEAGFGAAVRKIVEGETKFSKVGALATGATTAASPSDTAATDLQQLFLAMTEEVRIIVVKLADRLHNMRTLGAMPPLKQKRIADETLAVFAPLARLLGLYAIKEELEELAFRYSDPVAHAAATSALASLASQSADVVLQARSALEARLRADPYLSSRAASVHVVPLHKSAYWAHRKAASRGARLADAADAAALRVAALRVVVDPDRAAASSGGGNGATRALTNDCTHSLDEGDDAAGAALCYHAMGLVHAAWAPLPGAVKDYICTPKANGYQALHTTVLPFGVSGLFPLEVQIRSAEMHRRSEYGVAAAAWAAGSDGVMVASPSRSGSPAFGARPALKKGANGAGGGPSPPGDSVRAILPPPPPPPSAASSSARRDSWLAAIREWQAEFLGTLTAAEFVDCVTGDLLTSARVFCFTPRGDAVSLPAGATVVDFAYHVHTDVGNAMIGARVNGAPAPVDRALANADVVDVVTQAGPPTRLQLATHAAWLAHARTRSARHKLARFLREHGWREEEEEEVKGDAKPAPRRAKPTTPPSSSPTPRGRIAWLTVECVDRAGLLADVAAAISTARANIRSYSGAPRPEGAGRGGFTMRYELDLAADPAAAADLVAALEAAPGVEQWNLGCDL